MSSSILGASGLSSKKKPEETKGPLDHTGPTAPAAAPPSPQPDETSARQGQELSPEEREQPPVSADRELPGTQGDTAISRGSRRPNSKKKAESQPQTVYFGAGEREKAIDIEYALRRSGKFKGVVRGHISISLVMRTALDLLLHEFHDDPEGIIDRALRVQLQGVHGKS